MERPEDEFWHGTLNKVMTMIDMKSDEIQMNTSATNNEYYQSKYFTPKEEVIDIKSMKEIEGW